MPTTKQLRHALALNHHRNFHSAAAAQNISQSPFSRSIRALENTLGVSLFDRKGGVVTPTLFGEALLRRANTLLDEKVELLREIQLLKGLETGQLDIAAGIYAADISAGRALGVLIDHHPQIRCRLRLMPWQQIPDLVAARKVDLGIAEVSTLNGSHEFVVELLGHHKLILFCLNEHPLAQARKLTKADLGGFPVITVRLPPRVASVFPGSTQQDKETGNAIPAVEVDELMTARHIVARSNAIGVAAPLQIERSLRSGEFVALPFHASWLKLNYGFIHLAGRMLSPASEVYMQIVRDIDQELGRRNDELMREFLPVTGVTQDG